MKTDSPAYAASYPLPAIDAAVAGEPKDMNIAVVRTSADTKVAERWRRILPEGGPSGPPSEDV